MQGHRAKFVIKKQQSILVRCAPVEKEFQLGCLRKLAAGGNGTWASPRECVHRTRLTVLARTRLVCWRLSLLLGGLAAYRLGCGDGARGRIAGGGERVAGARRQQRDCTCVVATRASLPGSYLAEWPCKRPAQSGTRNPPVRVACLTGVQRNARKLDGVPFLFEPS